MSILYKNYMNMIIFRVHKLKQNRKRGLKILTFNDENTDLVPTFDAEMDGLEILE